MPCFEDFSGFRGFTNSSIVIPTALDVPPIQAIFFAHPYAGVSHGAKRLGELPCEGPAPAAINTLAHALGVHVTHIPATPEDLLAAWRDTRALWYAQGASCIGIDDTAHPRLPGSATHGGLHAILSHFLKHTFFLEDSMTTVSLELPDDVFSALRRSPDAFVSALR